MKNVLIAILLLLNASFAIAQNDDAKRAYNKGLALYHLDNYSDAIPHLSEAVVQFQQFEAAHQLLAICYDETNELDKSIAHYEKVVEINSQNKKAMFNLAKQYQRKEDYPKAKAAYNQALTVDPNYAKAKTGLAELDRIQNGKTRDEDPTYYKANSLYKQKKYDEAIQVLVPLNDQKPTANSLYLEGLCQEKLGDLNEAATRFQGATVIDPNYIDAFIGMGIIRYNQQEYEEAASHFENVMRLEEKPSEEFAYYLGNSLYRLGKYVEAMNQLNDAVLLDPNSGRAHYTLHKVYEQTDDEDKSLIHRIRAEELGYDGRYEDKPSNSKDKKPSETTVKTEETTETTTTKSQGPTVKGLTKEVVDENAAPVLSKKEQKAAAKKAKLEQKARDKANKELRKKQKKNPTYRE